KMQASARRPCSRLSQGKTLVENTVLVGDLPRSWTKQALKGNESRPAVGEHYQALASTACGIHSTAQWQMPVYHRKSGRNSPDTRQRKPTKFTRITNLKRCERQSRSSLRSESNCCWCLLSAPKRNRALPNFWSTRGA